MPNRVFPTRARSVKPESPSKNGRWFRFYEAALENPKVQKLSGDLFKTWINILCLASRHEGAIPDGADLAFSLRLSEKESKKRISALVLAGLIDKTPSGNVPHNWDSRQFKRDGSAERMRRMRARRAAMSDGECDVTNNAVVASPKHSGDGSHSVSGSVSVSVSNIEFLQERINEQRASTLRTGEG